MSAATIAAAEVRQHLQHVLSSASFEGSERASTLLGFLVDQTLRGEAGRLKEYTLGTEVLGKPDSFDPRIDPIVRTEMSRLRTRLERYYADEGRNDQVVITLPKGSYVPQFDTRAVGASGPSARDAAPTKLSQIRGPLLWFVFGAVAMAASFIAWTVNRPTDRKQPDAAEVRVEILTPPTTEPTSLAISPDGRQLVYSASVDGRYRLWVRSLDTVTARPLEGTDGARYPFWSPDGKSIGFFVADTLKRVDVETGAQQTLFNRAAYGLGGAWSPRQFILFNTAPAGSLVQTPAMGGAPTRAIPLAPSTNAQSRPHFLPDRRHVLYVAFGSDPGIYVGEVNGPVGRKLLDGDTAEYLPSSRHLLFVRQGTLFAQPFDPDRLELSGTPAVIAYQIAFSPPARSSALSTSAAGPFIYRAGQSSVPQQLVWFDRSGREIGAVRGSEISGRSVSMSLSPDGRQAAFDDTRSGTMDIWLLDVVRGVRTRFTSDPAEDMQPLWSPDGRRIVFQSNRSGAFDLWSKSTFSAEPEQLLLPSNGGALVPSDWSKDARFLLYAKGETGKWSIWALPMFGDRKPFPVVQSPADESGAQFSPDGRWIAYMSGATGRREIFIQRFPKPGRRWRVSAEGGAQPRWRGDGRELFFLAPDNQLMAAPIRLSAEDDAVDIGAPVQLFAARLSGVNHGPTIWNYIPSSDGQRFLMNSPAEVSAPITLVLNWKPKP